MPPAEPRLVETVALGLLQGPAELFPVSSSAHVGLLLRRRAPAVGAQGGRGGAAPRDGGWHWRSASGGRRAGRCWSRRRRLPALAGLLFERPIEERLGTPPTVAAGLLAGAAAMVLADRTPARRSAAAAGTADGAWLGLAQAAALIPGVSRSGATRAAARARGFGRVDAAELSREVALPVLAGAAALKGFRLARRRPSGDELRTLAAGAAAAAASTWAALRAERALTADAPLAGWAAYRVAVAAAIVATRVVGQRRAA